jgi:hypothetical protein
MDVQWTFANVRPRTGLARLEAGLRIRAMTKRRALWRLWLMLAWAAGGCSSSGPAASDGGLPGGDGASDIVAGRDVADDPPLDHPGDDGPLDLAVDSGDVAASAGDAAPEVSAAEAGVRDGGAPDGPGPGACSCAGGCPAGQRCLQNQFGGVTPPGVSQCQPKVGLAECRPTCGAGCPAGRPHCVALPFSAGCCSDAIETVPVCCANSDARDVSTCL